MIYPIYVTEIMTGVWGGACKLDDRFTITTVLKAKTRTDLEREILVRFRAQKQVAVRKGFNWVNHVDKFEFVYATKNNTNNNAGIYGLKKDNNEKICHITKYDKPLLTETEIKSEIMSAGLDGYKIIFNN